MEASVLDVLRRYVEVHVFELLSPESVSQKRGVFFKFVVIGCIAACAPIFSELGEVCTTEYSVPVTLDYI